MVDKYNYNDISIINELGKNINSNFEKLFHIDKLNENEFIFVYKENNIIVGFIHYYINFEVVELLNIIVKEKYQRKGIATTLLKHMIKHLPNEIERIILEVESNNLKAIKLYDKFNFTEINRRKKYYGNNDAIIMERKLL